MFAMFNQMFNSITVLFQALENIAKALLHVSTAAEQQAKAFADECAVENQATLNALKAKLISNGTGSTTTQP